MYTTRLLVARCDDSPIIQAERTGPAERNPAGQVPGQSTPARVSTGQENPCVTSQN
jgi:hypothetical protein